MYTVYTWLATNYTLQEEDCNIDPATVAFIAINVYLSYETWIVYIILC